MANDRPKLSAAGSHGAADRGVDLSRRSPFFEGRYGRMFRSLPGAEFDQQQLMALGSRMTAKPEKEVTPDTEVDEEENFGIPAGYTYLGQFIDHDLTFDPASSLQKQNDPDGLIDYRTPRFDLDSVYGRGPDDQPYLYEDDKRHMALGRDLDRLDTQRVQPRDLPRFGQRALIGDKRNDENVIVSQLHAIFLRFHNKLASTLTSKSFEEIQEVVRWYYQWIVLFDFLPRIVGKNVIKEVLPHLGTGKTLFEDKAKLHLFHWRNEPFMPIEFTAAVYRFGHSMVRPVYRLNTTLKPISGELKGQDGRKLIFSANTENSLAGFREFPRGWTIDWTLFFDDSKNVLSPENLGRERVQPAYKIDPSLVDPLGFLPEFSARDEKTGRLVSDDGIHPKPKPGEISNLAVRNLLRGARMGLPSGQTIARFMGMKPIPDKELKVGKATTNRESSESDDSNQVKSITEVGSSFENNAPLWFYVLAEAAHEWSKLQSASPNRAAVPVILGPVGGRIVAEVFVGLLLGDRNSFLSRDQCWRPTIAKTASSQEPFDQFTMGDLIKFVETP